MLVTRTHVFLLLAAVTLTLQSARAADAFFDSAHFSGSGNCAFCHNGLFDANGNDVSIETDWSTTIMANAARDPLWRAKFATEIRRNPQHEGVLNDKCTRCHAPMANQQAVFDGIAPQFFGNGGFEDPANFPLHDAAMDGVSCTLCHQIADVDLGTDAGESGHYTTEEFANPYDRPAYGQFTNPRINPMRINAIFTPVHSAHVSDSALCATCHNLKTPVLNELGELTDGEFPEQMVYSEWENSAFADGGAEASTCQQCHMARANGVRIANRPRFLAARGNFARHGFYGGNTLMLDILSANRAELDVGNGDFAAAIEATRATLRSAADLTIEQAVIEESAPGERDLVVRVRVSNNSGHKVPTSYPSRRAYIHLTVADQNGATLFESGRLETDASGKPTGAIAGVDADTGTGFEPHHGGEITSENQVQVYEAIMEDISGNATYTLLDAAGYAKDNRLLPRGFPRDPKTDPVVGNWDDIAIVGQAMLDDDFLAGSDLVTYRIPLGAATSDVTVSADLNYQSVAYGYLVDLFRDETAVAEVADFRRLYEASDVRVETIASVVAEVRTGGGNPIDQPPVASFSVACTELACTFDGTGSSDDGTIVTYAWDFGDGATTTGAQAGHTYAAAGTYTVTLTVTDNGGLSGTSTQQVTVSSLVNQAPVASFTFACTDLACTFDGTGSTDADGTVTTYAWAFGDGATATGATATHTYSAAGTYTATLTVTDNGSMTGSVSQTVTVSVNAPAPGPGPGPRWRR